MRQGVVTPVPVNTSPKHCSKTKMDYRSTSPQTSEAFSEEADSLSREKALLNRTKLNNNNISYLSPQKTPNPISQRKGRKTFAFWTLVSLLFILALGNLILTIIILSVLKLGYGMETIELVPSNSIKLHGNIDLNHIYKRDGLLEGYFENPIEITSEESSIKLNLTSRTGRSKTKLELDSEGATLSFNSFQVNDRSGQSIFNLAEPSIPDLKNAGSLNTRQIETNQIRSPVNTDLKIEADQINLKGAEGTKIDGKEVVWSADEDIYLKSVNGSLILSGKGVFLDVNKIPLVKFRNNHSSISAQFKLCVCMPQGKLFRVPVFDINEKVYCHHVNLSNGDSPCI